MKRLAALVCVAAMAASCGSESADAPAPAAAVEPPAVSPSTDAATTTAMTPVALSGLVSRDDVVITAPTVLWFWAPG